MLHPARHSRHNTALQTSGLRAARTIYGKHNNHDPETTRRAARRNGSFTSVTN